MNTTVTLSIADALAGSAGDDRSLYGFGGLHGGLAAAMLLRTMRSQAEPERVPIELTAHLSRPLSGQPELSAEVTHSGRALTLVSATASSDARTGAMATLALSARTSGGTPTVVPPRRKYVLPIERAERFVVPSEFVPISTRFEIRPATQDLPFSGAGEATLCAWVRLTEPVEDPWERLLLLADALAPSYAAVLTELRPIPTVRMTVRFTAEVASTEFSWVLVDATTTEAGVDGWLTEAIHLWSEGGILLASSSQLRLAR